MTFLSLIAPAAFSVICLIISYFVARERGYLKDQASLSTFRNALLAEIEKQQSLIKRMDSNPEFDNGIMADIRQERLSLLERLLEFETRAY